MDLEGLMDLLNLFCKCKDHEAVYMDIESYIHISYIAKPPGRRALRYILR